MTSDNSTLPGLFSDYRPEWGNGIDGDLFIRPPYHAALVSAAPLFLRGGRGTGKTTALRSLHYSGLTSIDHPAQPRDSHLGVYIRINKNRVSSFQYNPTNPSLQQKAFIHYLNLLLGEEFAKLIVWVESTLAWAPFEAFELASFAYTLGIDTAVSSSTLLSAIQQKVLELERYVNNPTQSEPVFSSAESVVRQVSAMLRSRPELGERYVFCCIDEYENLEIWQQAIVNTYIKHSESPITYKIGVRENGLLTRATVNNHDPLRLPDDCHEIEVASMMSSDFLLAVVERRLKSYARTDARFPTTAKDLLEELSRRDEARVLGAESIAESVRTEVANASREVVDFVDSIETDAYLIKYAAERDRRAVFETAQEFAQRPEQFRTFTTNYGYASLFWLTKGKKGLRIRKHYCGIDTFLALASGNVRYLLELLTESVARYDTSAHNAGCVRISARDQTLAAQAVSSRRLDQLVGLSARGVDLKRIVLGIGRVFFERARMAINTTPEVTQFVLTGDSAAVKRVTELLMEGVGQLAFEVFPRTKLQHDNDPKEDEFRLHPIFAPYFEFSHRKKRNVIFQAEHVELLLAHPQRALRLLLKTTDPGPEEELPQQLLPYAAFFHGENE